MIEEAVAVLAADREKRIKQPVPNVIKNVKFPLNQMVLAQYIAEIVTKNIGHQRDFNIPFFSFLYR